MFIRVTSEQFLCGLGCCGARCILCERTESESADNEGLSEHVDCYMVEEINVVLLFSYAKEGKVLVDVVRKVDAGPGGMQTKGQDVAQSTYIDIYCSPVAAPLLYLLAPKLRLSLECNERILQDLQLSGAKQVKQRSHAKFGLFDTRDNDCLAMFGGQIIVI